MAQRVVTMEAKLLAVFSSGVPLKVTALCRDLEISRQTLYKYRRRFEAEGPAGLVERSRRPHSSPGRVSDATEEAIIRLRKDLPLECGAQTIAYHLARRGDWPWPTATPPRSAMLIVHLAVASCEVGRWLSD
jgi:hypothetical protein